MNGLKGYVLARGYTEKTADALGAVKGKNCTIEKIEYKDGQTTVTFKWTGDSGQIENSIIKVSDGTPIFTYTVGNTYKPGDLVIYEAMFYRCTSKHTAGTILDQSCFDGIGTADGNFSLIDRISQRPIALTPADRKAYLCIETRSFSVWNGQKWIEMFKVDDELDEDSENAIQNKVVTSELKKKQDIFQKKTMPIPSADEVDNIYQYVGISTSSFTNGYFYKCIYDSEKSIYIWEPTDIQEIDSLTNEQLNKLISLI